jgi:hypothetical protein
MDADNLTYRERLTLRENLVGRAVMNAAATVMYAISDSGVTVLPVGIVNQFHRVEPGQEDVLIETSFCNRAQVSQTFTLADPGGNAYRFPAHSGPRASQVSPSSGVTPATITVTAAIRPPSSARWAPASLRLLSLRPRRLTSRFRCACWSTTRTREPAGHRG